MKLHERIYRWRKHAGLTMAALADACDVSSAAVAQWEEPDGTTPTSDNLEKIAKACKRTMSEFWGETPALPRKAAS